MIYPVDLSAATDAFVGHAIDNLDRAEKYRKTYTTFTAVEAFIWSDHTGRRSVVTVSATAQATREKDCYLLHVAFGGEAKDDFRSHKNDLIAAVTAALEAAGWALAQFKAEEDQAVRTNSDGFYFTLTRRQEEKAAELEPAASTELAS
jgi:hypothetical protein